MIDYVHREIRKKSESRRPLTSEQDCLHIMIDEDKGTVSEPTDTEEKEIDGLITKKMNLEQLIVIFEEAIGKKDILHDIFIEVRERTAGDLRKMISLSSMKKINNSFLSYKREKCEIGDVLGLIREIMISENVIEKNLDNYYEKAGDCLEKINENSENFDLIALFDDSAEKLKGGGLILSEDCDIGDKFFFA